MTMEEIVTIHYGEIALKRGKRPFFKRCLIKNLKSMLKGCPFERIEDADSRIILYCGDADIGEIEFRLEKVFGIEWFSHGLITKRDMDQIMLASERISSGLSGTIKVECVRSDKSFPLQSPDVSRQIGFGLERKGFPTTLQNPENMLRIDILRERAIITSGRKRGLGGLPVGSSGSVLSLLSGGIDSPVSSWLMMKRGCSLDFAHIHSFSEGEEVNCSKIIETVKSLRSFHPGKTNLFLIPYDEFYKASFDMPVRSETVLFRRFILIVSNRIAQEHKHLGIITGDSIGQVASQTLENLRCASEASELPIYRPLVSFNKSQIIDLAKEIRTYDISIEEYKDCCSLVAHRHPDTKVSLEYAKNIEKKIGIRDIVEKTIERTRVIRI